MLLMVKVLEKTIQEYQEIRDDLLRQAEECQTESDKMTAEIIKMKKQLEQLMSNKGL